MDVERRDARERIAEVLRRWDPLGVEPGVDGPVDEYDGYAPLLAERIAAGAPVEALAKELGALRVAMMAERVDEALDRRIAEELVGAACDGGAAQRSPKPPVPLRVRDRDRDRDEGSYTCPNCSEEIVVPLDPTEGESQRYVEDCPVCCNPIVIQVEFFDGEDPPRVSAEAE